MKLQFDDQTISNCKNDGKTQFMADDGALPFIKEKTVTKEFFLPQIRMS